MSVIRHDTIPRNPDPPRLSAAPTLAAYVVALEAYQQRRTVEGKAALFRSYRKWIGAFLDDDAEADRAAVNFLVALRSQSPNPKIDAAA